MSMRSPYRPGSWVDAGEYGVCQIMYEPGHCSWGDWLLPLRRPGQHTTLYVRASKVVPCEPPRSKPRLAAVYGQLVGVMA